MSHPSVSDRKPPSTATAWAITQDEAAELMCVERDGQTYEDLMREVKHRTALREVVAHALWLVDHTYGTSNVGVTMAREGDIEDLTAAVEELRKAGKI